MVVEAEPDKWQINHVCAKSICLVLISQWRSDQVETLAQSQALEHGLSLWGFHLPFPSCVHSTGTLGRSLGCSRACEQQLPDVIPRCPQGLLPSKSWICSSALSAAPCALVTPSFLHHHVPLMHSAKHWKPRDRLEHWESCGRTRRWLWIFECFADSGLARGSFHASAPLGFINETITCIWRQDHTVCKLLCFRFYWVSHCKNIPKPNEILVLVW